MGGDGWHAGAGFHVVTSLYTMGNEFLFMLPVLCITMILLEGALLYEHSLNKVKMAFQYLFPVRKDGQSIQEGR